MAQDFWKTISKRVLFSRLKVQPGYTTPLTIPFLALYMVLTPYFYPAFIFSLLSLTPRTKRKNFY